MRETSERLRTWGVHITTHVKTNHLFSVDINRLEQGCAAPSEQVVNNVVAAWSGSELDLKILHKFHCATFNRTALIHTESDDFAECYSKQRPKCKSLNV